MKFIGILVIIGIIVAAVLVVAALVKKIRDSREGWALAAAAWEVQVLPGRDQTRIVLRQVARVGSRTKVLHSEPFESVSRANPDHDIEVMIQKDLAEQYIKNALT